MNDTQDISFRQEDLVSCFNSLGRQTSIIDFEQINAEKEYFYLDHDYKEKSVKTFLGDAEESTEIDSILTPLRSASGNFKASRISEETTETEEILAILRKKSSPTVLHPNYSRVISKSSPQFYEAKRIPMKGRVIKFATGEDQEEVSSPVAVSNFSLPNQSPVPVRPKCMPRISLSDQQELRFFNKKEFCDEVIMSKWEKKNEIVTFIL